jgi:hypothetical protein
MRTKLFGSIVLLSILALVGCGSSDGASAGNQLTSLTISLGTLSPTFASGTQAYTASVAADVTSITVTPTAKGSGATIKVTVGQTPYDVTSGAPQSITLNATDPTTITIDVTSSDGKTTYTYTITVTHAAPGEKYIGSHCQCAGTDCKKANFYPFPPGTPDGIITGCENITTIPTGAELLCIRSYDGTAMGLPSTYFANGYCSVGALKCTETDPNNQLAKYICTMSKFTNSNVDEMESCPTGSVMITDSRLVSFGGASATVENKVCAKSCTQPSECRTGETDADLNKDNPPTTQYTCSDFNSSEKCNGNTLKFCFDPRTLTNNCVVSN